MKRSPVILILIIFTFLLSACGSQSSTDMQVAVAVALTQTAAVPAQLPAATLPEASQTPSSGILQGKVHLVSPPTPAMVVYAYDPNSNLWASTETAATDDEAPFTLSVAPGTYMIFAFAADDSMQIAGYPNTDGTDLGLVTVTAGQTAAGINLRPPDQMQCGSMWGVPPSPDGRFASVSASEECLAAYANGPYQPISTDLCQMLEQTAQETLGVPFNLNANVPFTDIATGEKGSACQLSAITTGDKINTQHGVVDDLKNAFAGWEEDQAYAANGPTGSAIGLRRDMALMLLASHWDTVEGVTCPSDEPIGGCDLTPAQKEYFITITVAMK